ncbi:MAG: cupin domain-containing protein [Goleter apudmare HA4340-LM2]|jgi:ribosomal protein L16 Arg81 hydroxylase|nr:cupin domain-containing protein [Goleter apudmare HA4340-LM2]
MKILQKLLAPYPVEQFLAEHWTQKAIHISASHPQKFREYFSWETLNYLLNYHRLTDPDIRFSKKGVSLSETHNPQNWSSYLRQGATLIVNGVHHRVPKVQELTANLQYDIGYPAHVNLYCSPSEQQGFTCHYDTHDVLILQIDGDKEWFVYPETISYPTPEMPSEKELPPEGTPYLQCILKPGDLLYIPRGHWHYAVACGEKLSLHLTVGIDCQIGLDWVRSLIDNLQNTPAWRQSLPPIVDGNTHPIEQHLNTLKQGLIESLNQADILHKYIDTLSYSNQPPLLINLPTQTGNDIFADIFTTRFTWSSLHRIRLKQLGEEHYQVQVGAKQVDLKGIPGSLIENLFNRDEFGLLDIADWAPELDLDIDIAPLITRLVTEGILLVKTEKSGL